MLKLWCPGTRCRNELPAGARLTTQGLYCSPRSLVAQQSSVGSGPSTGTGRLSVPELTLKRVELRSGIVPVNIRPSQGRPISVALIKQLVSSVVSNLDLPVSPTTCRESQPNIPLETFIRHAPTDSTSLQLPKPKLGATRVPGVGQTLSSGFLSRRRRPDGTAVAGFTLRETVQPRRSTLRETVPPRWSTLRETVPPRRSTLRETVPPRRSTLRETVPPNWSTL